MIETFSAIATALAVMLLITFLPKYFPAKLIATTALCTMAFIYVGFSMQGNTTSAIVLEILIALVFYAVAIIGYLKKASIIGYGILLHGVWDLLHHHALIVDTIIPGYWPPYCSMVDVIWGVYFILLFQKRDGTKNIKTNPVKRSEYA